ncbi:MAG: HEAT repeat domain-containing protein [Planctomycetaceae bacterium]
MRRRHFCIVFLLGLALYVAGATSTLADVVTLGNGGRLRGEIDWERESPDAPQVEIRTLSGASVIVERRHVNAVSRRKLILETYESLAKSAADTVESQWELAEWCRENQLTTQRRTHLLNVVRLEPDHERARKLLGHVRHDGRWTSTEELKLQQGYVKYGSQYVTVQERELLERNKAMRDAEKQWHKKIRLWYTWANGRNPERQKTGLSQLQAIREPDAIPGLAHFLGNNSDAAYRGLFVRILADIPGDGAVGSLVALSLHDEDAEIRSAAFDAIAPARHPSAVPFYIAELSGGFNLIVRRAASALGRIGDDAVVPALIEALVTTHAYRVEVPTTDNTYTFNADGSFGSGGGLLLPPHIEAMLRTGQLSNGVIVVEPDKPVRTKVVTVRRDHENAEALAALTKLTGESFGYDENAWRTWWAAQKSLRLPRTAGG